jgi:hypothetical protein
VAAAAAARPPPLQVRLLAAELAPLLGFSPRLIWSPVCSVVVVGWLVVGAVRADFGGCSGRRLCCCVSDANLRALMENYSSEKLKKNIDLFS